MIQSKIITQVWYIYMQVLYSLQSIISFVILYVNMLH